MFQEALKLMRQRREELNKNLREYTIKVEKEIDAKKQELENVTHAINELIKVQANYDKEQGNLAIQKGICPFPMDCNERNICIKNSCNADTLSNGYAYRMS